jgi:hypothetical protein
MEAPRVRPLRILHAASFGYRAKGVFLHGVATKLSNGWTRSGHYVVNFSARDIARWQGFGNRWLGAKLARKTFLEACEAFSPDVLVIGHADVLDPETLEAVRARAPGLKVIQWNVDWLLPPGYRHIEDSGENNVRRLLERAPHVDASFISTAGPALANFARSVAHPVGFLPNPVDPSVETARVFEQPSTDVDLLIVSGSKDPRRFVCGELTDLGKFAAGLKDELPDLRLNAAGLNGAPPVFGPAYQRALEGAAIGWNVSRHNDVYLYSSDRLAHMAGNGQAVLVEASTGYGDLFGEDEFAFYRSKHEIAQLIERLTRDDAARRAMARKGRQRYFALFDNVVVTNYMLDVVLGQHDARAYEWPTTCSPEAAPLTKVA